MNKTISAVLFIAGALLLYFGYQEYNSFGSELDLGRFQAVKEIVVKLLHY